VGVQTNPPSYHSTRNNLGVAYMLLCTASVKRVHNHQCMLIADFSGEICMYPDLTWYPVRLDYLQRQAELTFHRDAKMSENNY
jgi:hypothetical protein